MSLCLLALAVGAAVDFLLAFRACQKKLTSCQKTDTVSENLQSRKLGSAKKKAATNLCTRLLRGLCEESRQKMIGWSQP